MFILLKIDPKIYLYLKYIYNIKNKSSRTEVNQADEHLRIFEDGEKNSNLGKVHMQQLINTKIYLEFSLKG